LTWWRTTPRWAAATAVTIAAVLLGVGTATHVADLVRGGLTPYPWAPNWLNLYWSSLAVLDTLAAVLLLAGARTGIDLTAAILVTDLLANAYATAAIQHADMFTEPGVIRLAAFTAIVLAAAPLVRPHLRALSAPP
jgi:hypothetical protein